MAAPALQLVPAPAQPDDVLIEDVLRTARDMLGMDVAYIADTRRGTLDLRWVSGDGASFGIAAGDELGLEGTFCQLVLSGQLDGVVRDARHDPRVAHLPRTREAGIGAYLGLPLVLPDGTVHGTLCCLRHEPNTLLDEVEYDFLAVLARLIGKELHGAQERRAAQSRELERTTDRRRDADASQRAAERAHVAFDEAPIGSVLAGRDGCIQRVNRAMCTMAGRSPHELVGRTYLELLHPEDRGESSAAMADLVGGAEGPHRAEPRMVHSSGRIVEARVAVSAIHGADGQVEQLFAQVEDRTEINRRTRESFVAQSEILARLAAAGEFRDDDTGQHTRRVGALSAAIGARVGLPAEEVELLRVASPLHDIGKIAIPDAVLGKAGPLTKDEFELMKGHTTIGWRMLAGSSFAVLETAAEIALTHHERWDGTGYPAGLAGEEIPMSGRVVAVADVFDALTHARPYKPAWSTTAAIEEMAGQGGRHFDPSVLQAFLELQTSTKGTT